MSQFESQLQSKWNFCGLVRFNKMRRCNLMSYLGIADLSLEKKKKKIKVYNIFLIIMSSSHYLPLSFESDRQPL